jgi:O-methyltransferase
VVRYGRLRADAWRYVPQLDDLPADLREDPFVPVFAQTAPYTMTSPERMYALWQAVRQIAHRVDGAVVECGVWRGGSSMLAALALLDLNDIRDLYLYDTFVGMPPPSDVDRAPVLGQHAEEVLLRKDAVGELTRAIAGLEEVRANMARTGYPSERLHYVEGKVEDTIPDRAPERIAILRLDTDWYESTRHELQHLYPRLESGGVLIIDDYGWWEGARKAVDEYFASDPILLHRIDVTGRIAVKP